MFVAAAAVYCDSPPLVDTLICQTNRSQVPRDPDNDLYPYMTAIEYSCLGGRKFYDGLQSKSVLCAGIGNWSETNVVCQCKFSL